MRESIANLNLTIRLLPRIQTKIKISPRSERTHGYEDADFVSTIKFTILEVQTSGSGTIMARYTGQVYTCQFVFHTIKYTTKLQDDLV